MSQETQGLFKTHPEYKMSFETLQRAILNGDTAMVECTDKATGKKVAVVCAVQPSQMRGEEVEVIPLAKLFDGNPYDELEPPM